MNTKPAAKADTLSDMPLRKVLSYIGLQAFMFTAIGAALWSISGRSISDFVTLGGIEIANGALLAVALIAISAGLAKALPRYADWLVRSQARNYPFLKHRISIGAIVFISVCAGVGEEVLFRGGLQTWLGDTLGVPIAIILAAALFALIHFAQPLNSALIFIIGALFGAIYWQTGSLLTVIVGHAVYDVYALWALQEAMHRLGVFDDTSPPPLPADAARETLASTSETEGENS